MDATVHGVYIRPLETGPKTSGNGSRQVPTDGAEMIDKPPSTGVDGGYTELGCSFSWNFLQDAWIDSTTAPTETARGV